MEKFNQDKGSQNQRRPFALPHETLLSVISELRSETGRKSHVNVSGVSMEPLLPGGESIVIDHAKRDLKCGDIGVFNRGGVMVVHRVLWKRRVGEKIFYRTKGDSLLYMDEAVESESILGRVIFFTRKGKTYDLDSPGSKIYSKMMTLYSFLMAIDGKMAILMDKGMNRWLGGREKNGGTKEIRFFRNTILRLDRFLQKILHGLFFKLFHRTTHHNKRRPF